MKIGIFVEVIKAKNHTGISRYVKRLVESMVESNNDKYTFYLYYQKLPGEQKIEWLRDKAYVKHRALPTPINLLSEYPRLWWQYYLPTILKLDRINVFHGPNHYIPLKGSVPTVLTIHDIAYFFMNVHGEGMDGLMKSSTLQNTKHASHVVAVSQSTADDLIAQGVAKEKISVIYQGYEPNPKTKTTLSAVKEFKLSDSSPYLLFIGTIQPRKNVIYLIEEFAKVYQQTNHNLVISGAPGESFEEARQCVAQLELNDRVFFTGFISDEERHALYSNASIFLYPSLYEGFGLVILEAMSYGVPVITANNSSLPEAAGDSGVLIDVNESGALAEAIMKVLDDNELRNTLIQKGLQHSNSFNWSKSAKKMLNLYADIGNQRVIKVKDNYEDHNNSCNI